MRLPQFARLNVAPKPKLGVYVPTVPKAQWAPFLVHQIHPNGSASGHLFRAGASRVEWVSLADAGDGPGQWLPAEEA